MYQQQQQQNLNNTNLEQSSRQFQNVSNNNGFTVGQPNENHQHRGTFQPFSGSLGGHSGNQRGNQHVGNVGHGGFQHLQGYNQMTN